MSRNQKLKLDDLHDYQRFAAEHIINHKESLLLLDMGLGKTVSTLTAVEKLMFDYLLVDKTLVIAPKLVAQDTWVSEVDKWEHLSGLRVSVCIGSVEQRVKALEADADIYTINRENVAWLVDYYKKPQYFPFDMVVIDELSSFKSPSAKRFKALRKVRPFVNRVVGLTGTFNPNGYLDVWSQMFLIDKGLRLGTRYTQYRSEFFDEGRRNGHIVYEYILKQGAGDIINSRIADISVSMKSEDYLKLPERMYHEVKVRLSESELKAYKIFEKSKIMETIDGGVVTAVNAGVLSNKLLQYANGAVYDEDGKWHEVHTAKLEALKDLVESSNSPVMVAYAYQHDLERIAQSLAAYSPRVLQTATDISEWNAGKVKVLLVHPASAAHGHNLQYGGHTIVWFGNTFNLELYLQLNKRLHRQGQQHPVQIYHLVTSGTLDEDVLIALARKEKGVNYLMESIKTRIKNVLKKHEKNPEQNRRRDV